MSVAAIKNTNVEQAIKQVDANQKAIDGLQANSGMWKVRGIPGLYCRARAKSKSFMVQRRIDGELVKTTLGELPMKMARERAMKLWGSIERREAAVEAYINAKLSAGVPSVRRSNGLNGVF
jgi:hypothetical protein